MSFTELTQLAKVFLAIKPVDCSILICCEVEKWQIAEQKVFGCYIAPKIQPIASKSRRKLDKGLYKNNRVPET